MPEFAHKVATALLKNNEQSNRECLYCTAEVKCQFCKPWAECLSCLQYKESQSP